MVILSFWDLSFLSLQAFENSFGDFKGKPKTSPSLLKDYGSLTEKGAKDKLLCVIFPL